MRARTRSTEAISDGIRTTSLRRDEPDLRRRSIGCRLRSMRMRVRHPGYSFAHGNRSCPTPPSRRPPSLRRHRRMAALPGVLPRSDMRSTPKTTPSEEWWSWNSLDVHLDRLSVPESKLKVMVLPRSRGIWPRDGAGRGVMARKHGWETVSPDLPGYGLTAVPASRLDLHPSVDRLRRRPHRRGARSRRAAPSSSSG